MPIINIKRVVKTITILAYYAIHNREKTMQAAIYVRVSTTEQAEKGYSIDSQLNAGRDLAKDLGATRIDEYIDDGYSAEFLDRPDMNRLRENVKNTKYDYVIFYDPDRLARKLAHQLIITDEIEKSGAQLKFVSVAFENSPEGKLFYSIRGAISDFEKEKIKERTNRGKRTKALGGKLTFQDKPFGYAPDKEKCNYTIIESEAEAVRTIFQLFTDNQYGLRSLRLDLIAHGILTRAGKPFSLTVLNALIRNPMYAGTKMAFRMRYKTVGPRKPGKKRPQFKIIKNDESEWVPISVPAIIETEVWEKAQNILDNNRTFSKRNTKSEYLVRGIIRCDCCGYAMIAGTRKLRENYSTQYYSCSSKLEKRECDSRYIPVKKLDEEIWDYIYKAAKSRKLSTLFSNKNKNQVQSMRLRQELASLYEKQEAIIGWVRSGRIKIQIAGKDLKQLDKDIAAIKSAIASEQQKTKPIKVSAKEILEAKTFEQKRDAVLRLGLKIFARRLDTDEIKWFLE